MSSKKQVATFSRNVSIGLVKQVSIGLVNHVKMEYIKNKNKFSPYDQNIIALIGQERKRKYKEEKKNPIWKEYGRNNKELKEREVGTHLHTNQVLY